MYQTHLLISARVLTTVHGKATIEATVCDSFGAEKVQLFTADVDGREVEKSFGGPLCYLRDVKGIEVFH